MSSPIEQEINAENKRINLKEAVEADFNKTIDPNLEGVRVKIYRIGSNIKKKR